MRANIFRGILTAVAVFIAACSSTDSTAPAFSPAPARRDASAASDGKTTRSIDQYLWVSCANGGAGEVVHVTGEMHYESQRMQDASGVYHFNFKSVAANLAGVGLTTGTVFRGLMTEHTTTRAVDYLNENIRLSDIVRFVAPGSGDSYSLMASAYIVVDQGNYVRWDETWKEVCR
jgi:hypothetical protein